MTLEEFYLLEQDLQASGQNNKEYLIAKGIKPYQYYYWKRKAREQSAGSLPVGGSFLPINIQGSGLLGKGKGNRNTPFLLYLSVPVTTIKIVEFSEVLVILITCINIK